jgi:hypothetical protein
MFHAVPLVLLVVAAATIFTDGGRCKSRIQALRSSVGRLRVAFGAWLESRR